MPCPTDGTACHGHQTYCGPVDAKLRDLPVFGATAVLVMMVIGLLWEYYSAFSRRTLFVSNSINTRCPPVVCGSCLE